MENIAEWLKQKPLPEELIEVEPGVYTHPYEVIVAKLDKLCPSWSTQNFRHFYFIMPISEKDGTPIVKVSGSIEVVLNFNYYELYEKTDVGIEIPVATSLVKTERTLSGAATFTTTEYGENEHWAATVKSLAIVNAVQVLGPQFGWGLNSEAPNKKKQLVLPVKYKADEGIMRQFATAVEKKNVKAIKVLLDTYQIDTEGTDLTWVK